MSMPVALVDAPSLPTPTGPYALATVATGSRILHISGQVANSAEAPEKQGAAEQAQACLDAIDTLLGAAGAQRQDVVRVGVFLTDMADRAEIARVREAFFGAHRPAATLVQVAALAEPRFRVEIEATAVF